MKSRYTFAIIAVSILNSSAFSKECSSSPDQNTINQCSYNNARASDKELNDLYEQIMQRLRNNTEEKALLISSQRSWIIFRDKECAFAANAVKGGSIYPTIYSNCIDSLTSDRIKCFKYYLNCQEGDLSCPLPHE